MIFPGTLYSPIHQSDAASKIRHLLLIPPTTYLLNKAFTVARKNVAGTAQRTPKKSAFHFTHAGKRSLLSKRRDRTLS